MRRLRAWSRIALAARKGRYLRTLGRHLLFRARWRVVDRFGELPRYQLRTLERAFSRSPAPDLLLFSDFNMDWVPRDDDDYRHLPDMIRDGIGRPVSYESVVGPMYNARIVLAFLAAIEASPYKPRVIVVPLSTVTAQSVWLAHPEKGYAAVAADLRESIGRGRKSDGPRPRPTADELAAWDDLPLGADGNTAGKAQLISSSAPRTTAQQDIWIRNLMTLYHGERLRPDSPGVQLAAELGRVLHDLQIPSIAVIPAVPCDYLEAALGPDALEIVKQNADLLRSTFAASVAGTGQVLDLTCASAPADFVDAMHLSAAGRNALAEAVSPAVAAHLA